MNKYDIVLEELISLFKELLEEKDGIEQNFKENDGTIQELNQEIKKLEEKIQYCKEKLKKLDNYVKDKKSSLRRYFRGLMKELLIIVLATSILLIVNGYASTMYNGLSNIPILIIGGTVGMSFILANVTNYLIDCSVLKMRLKLINREKTNDCLKTSLDKLKSLEDKKTHINEENLDLKIQLETVDAKIIEAENSITQIKDAKNIAVNDLIQDYEGQLNLLYDKSGLSFPVLKRKKN